MTFTWIDVPGSRLPRRDEAIDFTLDGEPPFISVRYGDLRAEEMAYRDGTFLFPFLGSTHVGDAFALRRRGGWPSEPTVFVGVPAAGGVAPWGVLYHVDFRTLGAQTFTTFGEVTIDGLTWIRKAGKLGGDGTLGVNGLSACPAAVEGHQSFYGPRFLLPLANVPGFVPTAPVCIYARTHVVAGNPSAVVGIGDFSTTGTMATVREIERRSGLYLEGYNAGYIYSSLSVVANWSVPNLGTYPSSRYGLVIRPLDRRSIHYGAFDWNTPGVAGAPNPATGAIESAGNASSVQQLHLETSVDGTGEQLYRDMNNLSFFLAANGSTAANLGYLQELIVWQPGAGA